MAGKVVMNGPFVVAQASNSSSSNSSHSSAAPVQIIKVIKPPAGETQVFHASFEGTVKIDFTAIANLQITLYHDNTDQTLHIIFTDGSQAIIEPFFELDGVDSVEPDFRDGARPRFDRCGIRRTISDHD